MSDWSRVAYRILSETLHYVEDSGALDALIAALGDRVKEVRFWAAVALGNARNARALGALEAVLQGETDDRPIDMQQNIKDATTRAIAWIKTGAYGYTP